MQLEELKTSQPGGWLEIIYEGAELISDLRDKLDAEVEESGLEILRINNKRVWDREMSLTGQGETLSELDVKEVFERCLNASQVPDHQRQDLLELYDEVVSSLDLADWMAE